MKTTKLKILLADDHALVRLGLKASLEMETDLKVVAEVATGEKALEAYAEHRPDVVLLDLRLPRIDGIETMKRLIASDAKAKVIILSTYSGGDDVLRAMKGGAKAYLPKSSQREELLMAIRTVADGESYMPGTIMKTLGARLQQPDLTSREHEVLENMVRGLSNKEIAAVLKLEVGTVKLHVSKILTKLNARDRTQATTNAIKSGLVWLD